MKDLNSVHDELTLLVKGFVKCLHLAYVEYYVPISVFNAMIV